MPNEVYEEYARFLNAGGSISLIDKVLTHINMSCNLACGLDLIFLNHSKIIYCFRYVKINKEIKD